jgi:hypothetical protein
MLAVAGRPASEMLMSELLVAIGFVAVSLAGLVSLVAPVETEAVVVPVVVGVPVTGHEMDAPLGSEATGVVGVHAPTVTPGGRPVTLQETARPAAVADMLLVHLMVPEYGTPTVAVAGRPVRSGDTSAPITLIAAVAMLLARFTALDAPVVPEIGAFPSAVGVPETVHVMTAPGATDAAGTVGEQLCDRPAGRPVTAHEAAVAATAGAAALVQVNVPL